MGLDGEWVGATQRNSYFSLSVDPGEHHVCATEGGQLFAFAHFTAEAEKSITSVRAGGPGNTRKSSIWKLLTKIRGSI
jgi:hypothetical protein